MMQFSALDYIDEISPRPIYFVFGDRPLALLLERAYNLAKGPKEKYIVDDQTTLICTTVDKIPFAKSKAFQ